MQRRSLSVVPRGFLFLVGDDHESGVGQPGLWSCFFVLGSWYVIRVVGGRGLVGMKTTTLVHCNEYGIEEPRKIV